MINEFWRAKRVPPALVVTAGASVVTGGNGFLGKHRVRKLSERDAEVFLAGGGTLQRERAGEPFDSTQGRLLPRASAASRSASPFAPLRVFELRGLMLARTLNTLRAPSSSEWNRVVRVDGLKLEGYVKNKQSGFRKRRAVGGRIF